MSFDLTDDKINLNIWLSTGAAGVSLVLCTFILSSALWVYTKPVSRKLLDRVSFRLLLWSVGWEVVYDLAYIAVEVESNLPSTPNAVCAAGVWFMMAPLGVVNYLCTCIAINLMLTVCFGLNPIKLRLERWYIGVSTFLGLFIPTVPAILGHYGWDPVLDVCWIRAHDDRTRLTYLVLDLYLWQSLSCVVATLAVVVTLIVLFRQRQATSRAMLATSALNRSVVGTQTGHRCSTSTYNHLQDRFFRIALRISLYPISLIVVNGIITVGDLYISKVGGVYSTAVYGLYVVYYLLYGGRGIVFALLGIFVDPCLWRGMKSAWRERKAVKSEIPLPTTSRPDRRATEKQSFVEMLSDTPMLSYVLSRPPSRDNLTVGGETDRRPSQVEVGLGQALNRLHLEADMSMLPCRLSPQPDSPSTPTFTKSFSGVREDCLPEGLTDEVEDVRKRGLRVTILDEEATFASERHEDGATLAPLDPDLPDEAEERQRRQRAREVEREETRRLFEEAEAQL